MQRGLRLTALALASTIFVSAAASAPLATVAHEPEEPAPYHARPFDLRDLPFDRLPFTAADPHPLVTAPPVDDRNIALYRWIDGQLYYRPGSLAIKGMKRVDAYRDTGDRAQLAQALVLAEALRDMRIEENEAWWLPFWFDYPPAGLEAPWFDAMSQGLALAFFVRLHRVTGDPAHLEAAESIFRSFLRLGRRKGGAPRPWVAYVADGGYLWFEHYPNDRPDHVLNAHLHALNGLYEYWQHTRSAEARQLLEGALTTVRDRAGEYRRVGRISIYGMRSRTNHFKYHQIHIWQLRLLSRMTGDPFFRQLAADLAADREPKRRVHGQPAEARSGAVPSRAKQRFRVEHFPPVRPELDRAA